MKSTIRLFKAVVIASKRKKNPTRDILEKTIKYGFVLSPEVMFNYSGKELNNIIDIAKTELGLSGEQMNSSFHKSWKKVKDSSIELLLFEQLTHYFTTYGFEALGIYNEGSVYVPKEKLNVPELEKGVTLTVINGYTKKELKEKLLSLLQSGIALGEDTVKDVIDVSKLVGIKDTEVDTVRNKEVKIALYDYFGMFPESPIEFLRYIVYKATGKTLLIKDRNTLAIIKDLEDKKVIVGMFAKYKKKYGLEKMSQIFYRFKPIFLAFKTHPQLNAIVNKIRKLARKNHIPMKEDYLNSVTANIKTILEATLKNELKKVNTFRKIRLAYALKFRTKDVDTILYRIRNGKSYAKEFTYNEKGNARILLKVVTDSIVADMKKNVKGKKIYIPEGITYALPATEKQFTGDFPSGTYITVPKDMVVGIHWKDVDGHRIDIDMSMLSDSTKYGWDGSYRSEDRDILFSGDMTDAPGEGASELYYVKRQKLNAFILFANYYNYDKDVPVPMSIVVAKEEVKNLKMNYVINPNNFMAVAKTKIDQKQKVLGLLVTTTNECRFYFAEAYLGNSITSSNSEYAAQSRKYLFNFYQNTLSLNDMLKQAGAKMVKDKDKCDIDLSPETLEKVSIINLVK